MSHIKKWDLDVGRSERSWLDLKPCVISDDKVRKGFALSRTQAYSKMSVTLGTYGMCAINHQDARSMQTTFRVNRGKRGNKNCENAKLHSIPN